MPRYTDGQTVRQTRKISLLMMIQQRSKERNPMGPEACRTWMALNWGTRHDTTDVYLREWEKDGIVKLVGNKYVPVLTVEEVLKLVQSSQREVKELMEQVGIQ